MRSIYTLSFQDLKDIQESLGLVYRPKVSSEVLNLIYRYPNKEFKFKGHISNKITHYLKENYSFSLPKVMKESTSEDGTQKFLIEIRPGKTIECVLIPFKKNYTLCISSQIGCAMNCSFCHTAKQGLQGQLELKDFIHQYIIAKKAARLEKPIRNLVFMGQGEPLHNFENIKSAIQLFSEPEGISIGRSKMTVSTSGYLPGIERFDELGGVNFALSLHAVDPAIRTRLIPINRKYPLDIIDEKINNITLKEKQYIEYEYLLIGDLNDQEKHAKDLSDFVKNKKAIVNLIPFNEFPGSPYKRPSKDSVNKFKEYLVANGVRTMLRTTRGEEIMAACGQLNTN